MGTPEKVKAIPGESTFARRGIEIHVLEEVDAEPPDGLLPLATRLSASLSDTS
jgi:hypothetical protein